MIAIPIILFVFLLAFTIMMVVFLVGAIISYVAYCKLHDKKVEKTIEERYGKESEQ